MFIIISIIISIIIIIVVVVVVAIGTLFETERQSIPSHDDCYIHNQLHVGEIFSSLLNMPTPWQK